MNQPEHNNAVPVFAADPSWYWVVMETRESADYYREHGYVVTLKNGARVRSSVPIIDRDSPVLALDPHAASRWRKG